MKNISWGIIGCGDVTEVKSGPAFNLIENSRLMAVMRREGDKARDYARRHNVPAWYDRADDLINDPEVNAIYVATPPSTHADYAIQAMKAGKSVYVEKPMALNTGECEEMLRVSRETGQKLFVAYYRRALPYFLKIRELVEERRIGKILHFNLVLHYPAKPEEGQGSGNPGWRVNPAISGGGHFHDLASHQIDYLEFLFGPLKDVSGFSTNRGGLYSADDNVVAIFRYESGVQGTGSWCFTVPVELQQEQTEIIGTEGRIKFGFFGNPVIEIISDNQTEQIVIPAPAHIQQPMIEMVVNEILGKGVSPSNGQTGIRTTMIMDRIVSSIQR